MEPQNGTDTDKFLSLGPTPNEPHTPKEAVTHNNNNNVNVGSASGLVVTVAASESGVKRGRGRPRKYDVVGSAVSPATPSPGFSDQTKRGRGRPRGSGKLQILASIGGFVAETAGGSFIPHVLTVDIGQDVVSTVMSFFDKGPRAVCILSATGTVSSVALRPPSASAGLVPVRREEGIFEILSLSGSCTYTSSPTGPVRKTGELRISLAKPDGNVFGGVVESSLVAACPIQLIMASFKQSISNQIKRKQFAESSNDSERDKLKAPKLTEGEQSCPLPTATTNGVATSSNGVADNVTIASVNGVDLEMDCQTPQPGTNQRASADVNASVIQM